LPAGIGRSDAAGTFMIRRGQRQVPSVTWKEHGVAELLEPTPAHVETTATLHLRPHLEPKH
jgi:hypothetical protein